MKNSFLTRLLNAIQDIGQGLYYWRIWGLLAYQDICGRYRRSRIGPFWITISMAVTITALGFLYSQLFRMPIQEYIPYLASGLIIWNFISVSSTEATNVLVDSAQLLKQIKLPYSLVIYRLCLRNLIILLHNLLVMIPFFYLFDLKLSWDILFVFPGILVCSFFIFIYTFIFAIISARYRDIGPIIASLIQVAFFMTPIIWKASILPPAYQYLNSFNPLLPIIDIIRLPLLGEPISYDTFFAAIAVCLMGLGLLVLLLQYTYKKIIYWL